MRNFLLAGNVAAIAATTAIDKAPAGALGFYYMNNGVPTVDATGKLITGYGQIVMGRASKDGGPIIIPFIIKILVIVNLLILLLKLLLQNLLFLNLL